MRAVFLVALCLTPVLQAQTCTPGATAGAAARALSSQSKLLAASIPEMDTDVPPALRPTLHDFKQALIYTTDTGLRCNNPEPGQIQANLTTLLHANRPPKPQPKFAPSNPPPFDVGAFGNELQITVKPVPSQPGLFSIMFTYAVECGDDNILLLYRRTPAGYQRELVWQNPDLNSSGDAFGDFFVWTLVPGPNGQPLVAAAHGHPWCSSRMSAFDVDLLSPATNGKPQATLAHLNESYSRFEHMPEHLKLTPDGFQLRVWDDSLDFDNLFIRPRLFTFRTTAGKLDRVQPIADNARDFVDAWLGAAWPQASRWAESPSPALKSIRDRFDYTVVNSRPELTFGPVRGCGSQRFQIEMDLAEGEKLERESTLYASVRQNPNSFTMLTITPQPDPTCTGPDLMKKPPPPK